MDPTTPDFILANYELVIAILAGALGLLIVVWEATGEKVDDED